MATFLDVTGLAAFSKIFVFLLVVFILVIAFMASKWFAGKEWVAWLVAILVSIFVILSDLLVGIIRHITPWIAVVFIFAIFIGVAAKIFGGSMGDLGHLKWGVFLVVVLIIIIGTLTYIRDQVKVPGDIDEDGNEIKDSDYTSTTSFVLLAYFLLLFFQVY